MTICDRLLLGIGIGILAIFVIALTIFIIVTIIKCRKLYCGCCKYWNAYWNNLKYFNNEGCILPIFKYVFFIFEHFSVIVIIRKCIEKCSSKKWQYRATDIYTVVWFIILFGLFCLFIFSDFAITLSCPLLAIVSYRLFDIFQFWVSEYILGKIYREPPINISRTLILIFINYFEITISFSLIAFIKNRLFDGIDCMTQAFYYAVRNAVTIGSSDVTPTGFGYGIYVFQLMFVLLFLTVVVSNIVGYKKRD